MRESKVRGKAGEGGELCRRLVRKEVSLWGKKGKIMGDKFASGGKKLKDKEHGVMEQDWTEFIYKEGKRNGYWYFRGTNGKKGELSSRCQ